MCIEGILVHIIRKWTTPWWYCGHLPGKGAAAAYMYVYMYMYMHMHMYTWTMVPVPEFYLYGDE